MAYYAELDHQNIVIRVIPGWDETVKSGMEQILLLETGNIWKRTSYNTQGGQHPKGKPFRKNFAGIGYTYDAQRDAFIPPRPSESCTLNEKTCRWIFPQPFPSWVLNEETGLWDAPTPYPTDGQRYQWDEATTSWVIIDAS